MDKLADILGSTGLPKEILDSLQEAFDKKVIQVREEAEMSIREEFAARFNADKQQVVEAIDLMLTDIVKTHEESKLAEIAKLSEARNSFRKAVKESRQHYRTKLKEHLALTRDFALKELTKEANALRSEKKSLAEAKAKLHNEFNTLKENTAKQQAARLKKIDEFVVRQVSKELKEFDKDHRALVETRVKLISESRSKLKEMQTKFIKQSASKVESMVNESLKRELTQLHEDLERNRQNIFGRRIFEAVAAEYMTSYLSEGSEVRKLQSVLESTKTELNKTKSKLSEVEQTTEVARRKAALAEDRANRAKVMTELLSNLRGDKRVVMEGMLETIKTSEIRNAFKKFLPAVLGEAKAPQGRKLMEGNTEKRNIVEVTGDHRNTRVFESAQAEIENEINTDLEHVIRLAGIQK